MLGFMDWRVPRVAGAELREKNQKFCGARVIFQEGRPLPTSGGHHKRYLYIGVSL